MASVSPFLSRKLTIAVASGKGGTGKTLIATNLAAAAARGGTPMTLIDCDSDAPNDALFLVPAEPQQRPVTVPLAEVDTGTCTVCGACKNACAYGAIRILGGTVMVFAELCHGCGACIERCPVDALHEIPQRVGEVEWGKAAGPSDLADVHVVTGRLDVGDVKAPTVIRAARRIAEMASRKTIILDASPGVACSTVAGIRGADLLLLVTEPTPFGLHDLERAVRLGRDMDVPMGVIINRAGSGDADIEGFCRAEGVKVLATIPFDRRVAEVYADGRLIIDGHPDGADWFRELWDAIYCLAEEEL